MLAEIPVSTVHIRHASYLVMCAICLGSSSCQVRSPNKDQQEQSEPPTAVQAAELLRVSPLASPRGSGTTLFERLLPEETGVHFVNWLKPENNVPYIHMGAGVAVADYAKAGRADLSLLSVDCTNRLYRQVGDFQFQDVTHSAGGVDGGDAWSRGATFFDANNDGHLDLYICNTEAPNLFYLNRADGTFVEAAADHGLDFVGASVMASVADYDMDGDLDLYVVTHRPLHHSVSGPVLDELQIPSQTVKSRAELEFQYRFANVNGRKVPVAPRNFFQNLDRWEIAGQADALLQNDGQGKFTNVTHSAGIGDDPGLGLSSLWLDFDNDGWLDLFVANDLQSKDRLYRNNHDGTFTEMLADTLPHTTWFSRGSDFGVINNDGRFDLLVADMASTTHYRAKVQMGDMDRFRYFMEGEHPAQIMRNALFLNTGTGRFMEIAQLAGLAATDWTWAVKLNDLDNDGWVDALFTNGVARADEMNPDMRLERERIARSQGPSALLRYIRQQGPDATRNLAFQNKGTFEFDDVSSAWGIDHTGISYGAAQADFDGDGDLDLVVNNHNEPTTIYRNTESVRHRVLVRLSGTHSNRFGIGAKVTLETSVGLQVRQLFPVRGYMTCDEPVLHFGLGTSPRILRMTIDWPSGHRQIFEDLPVNQTFEITEPPGKPSSIPSTAQKKPKTQFQEATPNGLEFRHREFEYNDYGVQPLLPGKLSQLGPGLAWGDANGDGRDDLFVGGAAGQSGELFLSEGGLSGFRNVRGPWQQDEMCEDMAPLWLDVDSDDDMDLLVSSGSSEHDFGDHRLRDRLYLNDGHGEFEKAPAERLPAAAGSSSVVAAADYDADGDLDLFIGERLIPGDYPRSPDSRLLRNERGTFVDVTEGDAPELRNVGLVTSALWSDVDDDGRADLLVTLEWGPIKLFRNADGKLHDRTIQAGLDYRLGWWNAIAGGDMDADGDMDYVVLNTGYNTKYGRPSPEKPTLLYHGDMDESGGSHLVEVKVGDKGLLPIRGLSCSSSAMPSLKTKFGSYHAFASSLLTEIYPPHCLERAQEYTANELASGLLINSGDGTFHWQALPMIAQAAPGFGVTITDFDADGHNDIYFVQNLFTREPETGVWDGGLSLLLRRNSRGEFLPVWPDQSGLIVTGDAKGMAVCDLNNDSWPDIAVTQNNDRLLLFQNSGSSTRRSLRVELLGPIGNPTGIGARVILRCADGTKRSSEVYAGSGYLSQSSAHVYFGLDPDSSDVEIEVRWPDGVVTEHLVGKAATRLVLKHPSR